APGEEFDLGDAPDSSQLAFELTGRTADGTVVARGRSVRLTLGSLNTTAIPLFIQRLDGFARPPGELVRAHVHAPAGVVGENFLVATGGDAAYGEDGQVDPALGDFYDIIHLVGSESGNELPRAARSMLVRNSTLILIDDEGASYADLSEGTTSDIDPPEGMTWDEVSGGETIDLLGDDLPGLSYVVGATRPDEPTDAVLVLDDSGSMSVVRLSQPRRGASAVYVPGLGLAVVGGATEADGPGIEIIGDDGASVSSIPYPTDATEGAAAVLQADKQIVVLGGRRAGEPAPTRAFDLGCLANCEEEIQYLEDQDVDELASHGHAYKLPDGTFLTVGEAEPEGDGPGETLAFIVDIAAEPAEAVRSLPLRDRRRGATPIAVPNGTLAIIGGITPNGAPARSVEYFFPE
ncbi:MAG: hypothetical protein HOW73_30370, partial [Polyangiaceae bacterium]|nr:hypothetical protein [Polyangiaceae bacterium]